MNKHEHLYVTNLLWLGFFAIWMAYVESAVVVYLRELYPAAIPFQMQDIPRLIITIEIGREAATIFMILAISFLLAKRGWMRTAYFMFCFGVWDLWYYIWLYIFIEWPASLLTWDVLFLIPAPWAGPVLAPVIVSVSLIIGAIIILHVTHTGIEFHLTKFEWIAFLCAPMFIFSSFILQAQHIIKMQSPTFYHWELLVIGEMIGFAVLAIALKRLRKQHAS